LQPALGHWNGLASFGCDFKFDIKKKIRIRIREKKKLINNQ
jgi:hypothetical protein